jgi:hypothetical protein
MSNKANTSPQLGAPDTAPVVTPRHMRNKNKNDRTHLHDVYQARYKHVRTLRLLSFVVGGSILLILFVGMWRLYTVVVTTITDAESLLTLTGPRPTSVIQFDTLERVRTSSAVRLQQPRVPLIHSLFPSPTTTTRDIQ